MVPSLVPMPASLTTGPLLAGSPIVICSPNSGPTQVLEGWAGEGGQVRVTG